MEGGRLTPSDLAAALAGVLTAQLRTAGDQTVAKFDVYLEAARRPDLRATARHWIESFARLAAAGANDPAGAARLLVAAVDGLVLKHLASAGPTPDVEHFEQRLEQLIAALLHA